jgi:hypothetical protein
VSPNTPSHTLESLEDRRLMAVTPTAAPWGFWPNYLGLAKTVQNYPWLDGGGQGVAVVDKGIDYWHPALGGNRATGTKSPRIVNVYDYRDNDTDPFPNESEKLDGTSPHGTGVAGILAGIPYVSPDGQRYQGVIQNTKLYNIRTNRFDSQNTIKKALAWVVTNRAKYNITAINLTDFVGTSANPVYASEIQTLWNAGVFVATPVANDWQNPTNPRGPIGYPAVSPYIFGVGGHYSNGTISPKTQRGNYLDLLGPADGVQLPYYVPSTGQDIWVRHGSGNSWANPYVVGTAVLLKQIDPTISPTDIMKVMQDSGFFVSDPDAAYTGISGYKRLNIYNAVGLTYSRRDDVYDQGSGGNDDLAHAKLLPLDTTGKGAVTGVKLLIHDHDYFAFDVKAAGTYNLKVGYTGSSPFPGAELLNSAGAKIANVGGGTGLNMNLAVGRYYFHEYNATRSVAGTYSLNVAKVTTTTTTTSVTRSLATTATTPTTRSLFATDTASILSGAVRKDGVWSDTPIN